MTGKNSRQKSTGKGSNNEEELKSCPHTFVFNRGQVGKNVLELVSDVRHVMEPFTAKHLKVRRKNVLKDFVSVAGPLNVSHFVMFSKTESSINFKVARLPRGPTLTFKVSKYCLSRDVISAQKRRNMNAKDFLQHPLLVMNNFSGDGMHIKLMATMFQNMFPSINVNKVKLKTIRRCVLLNYDPEKKEIEFRHYTIRAVPSGVSRSVKKLIKTRVPNLARYDDVSEFFTRGDVSESEGEMDGPHNEVILPQNLSSRGNMKSQKSAIRLSEIGPRMTLSLVKIEEGLSDGNVLYHEFIQKTEAEQLHYERKREKKKKLKAERKRQQEMNVDLKKQQKEVNNKRSMTGIKAKEEREENKAEQYDPMAAVREDIEYFKQEVGEDPEPELFPQRTKGQFVAKKRKFSNDNNKQKETPNSKTKKVKFSTDNHDNKRTTNKDNNKRKPDGSKGQKQDAGKPNNNKSKKKPSSAVDIMRRSKQRKEKRTIAKKRGKRANKPRKC